MLSSYTIKVFSVAPFAGAWIEICIRITNCKGCNVAPFAGAWIEIHIGAFNQMQPMSLPSRERGLKLHYLRIRDLRFGSLPSRERGLKSPIIRLYFFCGIVAPFAGAWIEITHSPNGHITMPCRSLRGSVD